MSEFHRFDPQDGLCPMTPDSWCKYDSNEECEQVYKLYHSAPQSVAEAIQPVFERHNSNWTYASNVVHEMETKTWTIWSGPEFLFFSGSARSSK